MNFNSSLAEELTQETFYQTFISLHRFRGDCEVKTWICQIAKNACLKYFKKNPIHISLDKENFAEDEILEISKLPEDYSVSKDVSNYIIKSMQGLKSKYREVLIYRLYFEMSFVQIGLALNISKNSAKVIYYRGKELIKKEILLLFFIMAITL